MKNSLYYGIIIFINKVFKRSQVKMIKVMFIIQTFTWTFKSKIKRSRAISYTILRSFIVPIITKPPGLHNLFIRLINRWISGKCSITSMQVTTSNCSSNGAVKTSPRKNQFHLPQVCWQDQCQLMTIGHFFF